jgi:hypothetical protein
MELREWYNSKGGKRPFGKASVRCHGKLTAKSDWRSGRQDTFLYCPPACSAGC